MFLRKISLLLAFAGLAGCSLGPLTQPLTKDDCVDGQWQEVGLRDGRDGTPESPAYQRHLKECARFGGDLAAEKAAYTRGLAEGLVVYCHVKNAERLGESGRPFHELHCPVEERSALLRAYRRGRLQN